LNDSGITKSDSSRWQQMARIPAPAFDAERKCGEPLRDEVQTRGRHNGPNLPALGSQPCDSNARDLRHQQDAVLALPSALQKRVLIEARYGTLAQGRHPDRQRQRDGRDQPRALSGTAGASGLIIVARPVGPQFVLHRAMHISMLDN
jgi:hypothetical protein